MAYLKALSIFNHYMTYCWPHIICEPQAGGGEDTKQARDQRRKSRSLGRTQKGVRRMEGWTQNWESQRCNRTTVVLAYRKRWHYLTKTFLILFLKLQHKYFRITMEKMLSVKGADNRKRGLKQQVALGGDWRAAPSHRQNPMRCIGHRIYSW